MSKPIVRCRCGHQVLGREVLRSQPCEKPSGAEAVYVKYRCRRCKKIGEAFIPHDLWSPDIFDVPHDEISAAERDRFTDADVVNSGDVISFHRALQKATTVSELWQTETAKPEARRKTDKRGAKDTSRDSDKSSGDKPPRRSRGGS